MRRYGVKSLIALLFFVNSGCSNRLQITDEPIPHETIMPTAMSDEKKSEIPSKFTDNCVAMVDSLSMDDNLLNANELFSPNSAVYTLDVDTDKVNYITFSLYKFEDGNWTYRPITMLEKDGACFNQQNVLLDIDEMLDEQGNSQLKSMSLNFLDDAMKSVFQINAPLDYEVKTNDSMNLNGSAITSEHEFELNKEVILYYYLFSTKDSISSPNTDDLDEFKKMYELSDDYSTALLFTVMVTDTKPLAFQ